MNTLNNDIIFVTEASDKFIHLTRTCIHTFIKENKWFNGTVVLLTHEMIPFSNRSLTQIRQIYPKIELIPVNRKLIDGLLFRNKIFMSRPDLILDLLKLSLFELDKKVLYSSCYNVFLSSIHMFLSEGKVTIHESGLSIFYKDSNIYYSSGDIEQVLSDISDPLTVQKIDESLINSISLSKNIARVQEHVLLQSVIINDKKYNQFITKIKAASIISYTSIKNNTIQHSKIDRLWQFMHSSVSKLIQHPVRHTQRSILDLKRQASTTNTKVSSSINSRLRPYYPNVPVIELRENIGNQLKDVELCVCTICNDSFTVGTQILIRSFIRNNKWFNHPIIVLYCDSDSPISLENRDKISSEYHNVIFKKIDTSEYKPAMDRFKKLYANNPEKLRFLPSLFTYEAFSLTSEYERVLYLDSDMLVQSDISELFNLNNDIVGAPDSGVYELNKSYRTFNGGLLSLKRSLRTLEMKSELIKHSLSHNDDGYIDQSVMNSYLAGKIHLVSSRYNCLKRCFSDNNFRTMPSNIKIVHYVGAKPWQSNKKPTEQRYSKIENLWKKYENSEAIITKSNNPKIAVIIHLYYQDLWNEVKQVLNRIPQEYDLYISLSSDNPTGLDSDILEYKEDASIFRVENRGADVGPFFTILNSILDSNIEYEWVLKLHSKKSKLISPTAGDDWRKLDFNTLVPDNFNIISNNFNNRKIGMIGTNKHRMSLSSTDRRLKKNNNQDKMNILINYLKLSDSQLDFFGGTMFWIRFNILSDTFRTIRIKQSDFEIGHQKDATLAHAMERVFANIVRDKKYKLLGV